MTTNIMKRSEATHSCSVFPIISWTLLVFQWLILLAASHADDTALFCLVLLLQFYFWSMTSLNQDQVGNWCEYWILKINIQSFFCFVFLYLGEKSVLGCVLCPVWHIAESALLPKRSCNMKWGLWTHGCGLVFPLVALWLIEDLNGQGSGQLWHSWGSASSRLEKMNSEC